MAFFQELLDGGIQFGPAHAEEGELAAEGADDAPADEPVQDPGNVFVGPGEDAAFLDGGPYTVLNHFFDNQRDRADDGGLYLFHGWNQYGRGSRFLKCEAGSPHIEGVERRHIHLIHVGGRKDAQEPVFFECGLSLERSCQVGTDVPMAEHDAFGFSGGAGSVDDGGKVVRLRVFYPTVALEIFLVFFQEFEGFNVYDQRELLAAFIAQFPHHALGNEQDL